MLGGSSPSRGMVFVIMQGVDETPKIFYRQVAKYCRR